MRILHEEEGGPLEVVSVNPVSQSYRMRRGNHLFTLRGGFPLPRMALWGTADAHELTRVIAQKFFLTVPLEPIGTCVGIEAFSDRLSTRPASNPPEPSRVFLEALGEIFPGVGPGRQGSNGWADSWAKLVSRAMKGKTAEARRFLEGWRRRTGEDLIRSGILARVASGADPFLFNQGRLVLTMYGLREKAREHSRIAYVPSAVKKLFFEKLWNEGSLSGRSDAVTFGAYYPAYRADASESVESQRLMQWKSRVSSDPDEVRRELERYLDGKNAWSALNGYRPDLIVPSPTSSRRPGVPDLLAGILKDRLGIRSESLLFWEGLSGPQHKAGSLWSRISNVAARSRSFDDGSAVAGLRLLLVDDVYTTGATSAELRATLLKSGALEVRTLALLRSVTDPCRLSLADAFTQQIAQQD